MREFLSLCLNSWCSLLQEKIKEKFKSYSAVMNDVINIFKVEFGLLRVVFCVCVCFSFWGGLYLLRIYLYV